MQHRSHHWALTPEVVWPYNSTGKTTFDTLLMTTPANEIVQQRRRQQRSIETREKVLKAAAAEFAEHGFQGASTRSVADKAGVQHALVIYHFKSKEGLWRTVISAMNERFATMYRSRLEGLRGVDAALKLKLIMEDFIRFSAANPSFHWLMAHEANKGGKRMNWLLDEYVKQFFKTMTDLIKAAQKDGRFVAGDPYHLQYIFLGAATHLYMLAAEVKKTSGRSPTTPSYVEEHVKLCLSLFFKEPGV